MGTQVYSDDLDRRMGKLIGRIDALEAQVARLSEAQGIAYEPPASGALPPSVAELVGQGKRREAIMEYRRLTGAGLEEAQTAIDGG